MRASKSARNIKPSEMLEALILLRREGVDAGAVRRFATGHKLKVLRVNVSAGTMVLRGRAKAMERAFGVKLLVHPKGYRSHRKALTVPKELAAVIAGVFGLDNRPVAKRPGRTSFPPPESMTPPPVNANTRLPKDFRRLYQFPKNATGKGQCIAVLEFGGGFAPAKLRSYLAKLGVRNPRVKVREIPPGGNRPLNQVGTLSPDAEVYMDLEILASIAPDATLVVYFAENSSRGWIEALQTAIFDRKYRPSVLSICWGQAERSWDAQTVLAIEAALQTAARLGITVCCASGDRGVFESAAHPYSIPFPASSPHVLACGGTRLEIRGRGQRETVWNESRTDGVASGGGISRMFGLPAFQEGHKLPARFAAPGKGRGIPDVAANASASTGYLIWADGIAMSLGGTSAAAPLWAGLVACLNEAIGRRVGYLTPLLYTGKRNGGLRSITRGNNRLDGQQGYDARKAWDPCTGLGSPHGVKLLGWLKRTRDLKS
jgi:kumamolisin